MHSIAKNLKQIRQQRGWTQQQLADVLFVTRQTVSNWENGKSMPDLDMLTNIAETLNTDVNILLYGPSDKSHPLEKSFKKHNLFLFCELILFIISIDKKGIIWPIINSFWAAVLMCFSAGVLICLILKVSGVFKNLKNFKHYKPIRTAIIIFMMFNFLFLLPLIAINYIRVFYYSDIYTHQFTMKTFYETSMGLMGRLESLPVYQFIMNSWMNTFLMPDKPFLIQYIPYIACGFIFELVKPSKVKHKEADKCTVSQKI